MSPIALTTVAMITAGIMLAHQVASKAFRDAAFLTAWPATALPVMIARDRRSLVVALVPLFSRLLDRFSPLVVVSAGFVLSAAGQSLEWTVYEPGRWVAVVIYLHLAGVSALLLSGFWSLIAERFDPARHARSYGRIAAAGTFGGVVGSIAADRVASMDSLDAVLLLLAALHVAVRHRACLPATGADTAAARPCRAARAPSTVQSCLALAIRAHDGVDS